ncbi:HD domain-containing protein [Algoriphagus mannitolivorans]|uniref:HD domain-containing protein n=1 Tax=Algoriphagus mannitolivorans TaxID=226504 RepID=UPI0003F869E1|nr:HD domain-containing protein [Algoriphagus mannitolivorans]
MKSQKILNDPVYGFITIPSELIFAIIDHPYFQRLRRIRQLGLTDFVYPGALHTRFHHAIGAMHLMSITLDNLRIKGTEVSDEEYEAALIAILLHDIGHGPFSHALEYSLLEGIPHEKLSIITIEALNREFGGKLDLALQIFRNQYPRKFLNQLVSSQLDIDRLDYLQRDCFFTGVSEGTIGADRIIKMMAVHQEQLVIEEKGIYSIENFLSARRLMYWQVYLHKTTVSAEKMLINLITRAKNQAREGASFPVSEEFDFFLKNEVKLSDFQENPQILEKFLSLDDYDIWGAIKLWKNNPDYILANISQMFLTRNLFKISLVNEPFSEEEIQDQIQKTQQKLGIPAEDLPYFFSYGKVSNYGYLATERINILTKKGKMIDVALAADLPNIQVMSKIVEKFYVCKAKNLILSR